jgi:hypothetical protein
MRNPGRRATAKACAAKPKQKERWTYKGQVPQVVEEDREFYLLFCESKDLEAAIAVGGLSDHELTMKQARFYTVTELIRRRWIELMEPPVANPARRLLELLKNPKPPEPPDA